MTKLYKLYYCICIKILSNKSNIQQQARCQKWTCLRASANLTDLSAANIKFCPLFFAISHRTLAVRTVSFLACTNTITFQTKYTLQVNLTLLLNFLSEAKLRSLLSFFAVLPASTNSTWSSKVFVQMANTPGCFSRLSQIGLANKKLWVRIAGARVFACQMSFLSLNRQSQSTEGKASMHWSKTTYSVSYLLLYFNFNVCTCRLCMHEFVLSK